MIAALIIVFREVLEAGLIVGIVMAVTRGVPGSTLWINGGIIAGVAGACGVALFVSAIANAFNGVGQDVLNGVVLAIAASMLIWHNIWMAQHGREMTADLQQAGKAVVEGQTGLLSLAIVVAVAVLREGSEIVLFLFGVAAGGGETWPHMLAGSLAGLLAGALVGTAAYAGLTILPPKLLFRATTILIALLAAGMAAQSIGFLEQADILPQSSPLWNSSSVLSQQSLTGRIMHTLIGYIDQPSLLQLITYGAVILVNFGPFLQTARHQGHLRR